MYLPKTQTHYPTGETKELQYIKLVLSRVLFSYETNSNIFKLKKKLLHFTSEKTKHSK